MGHGTCSGGDRLFRGDHHRRRRAGSFDTRTRETIDLAVGTQWDRDYYLFSHTLSGRRTGLDVEQILSGRRRSSS